MNTEKLTIEHLCAYLPYGLRINIVNKIGNSMEESIEFKLEHLMYYKIESIKPILRSLSDLTKEITHDGKTFIPFLELENEFRLAGMLTDLKPYYLNGSLICIFENKHLGQVHGIPFEFWQRMFSWHFDVFSLIPKSLAIDINKLTK